jgi:hypothetical protein
MRVGADRAGQDQQSTRVELLGFRIASAQFNRGTNVADLIAGDADCAVFDDLRILTERGDTSWVMSMWGLVMSGGDSLSTAASCTNQVD